MRTRLVAFDTETTSNKPESTRVVQWAAIEMLVADGTKNILLNENSNPEVNIHPDATEVHGIKDEDVANCRLDKEIALEFYEWLERNQDDIIIAGQNVSPFDLRILYRLAARPPLPIPVLDTLTCATRIYPDAPNHRLSEFYAWLGLGTGEGAHDAMVDIEMVIELAKHFSEGLQKSFEEMAEWCKEARILKRAHFGKHKGKLWGNQPGNSDYVPRGYVRFIIDKFDDPTPDMVATVYHHYNMKFKALRR